VTRFAQDPEVRHFAVQPTYERADVIDGADATSVMHSLQIAHCTSNFWSLLGPRYGLRAAMIASARGGQRSHFERSADRIHARYCASVIVPLQRVSSVVFLRVAINVTLCVARTSGVQPLQLFPSKSASCLETVRWKRLAALLTVLSPIGKPSPRTVLRYAANARCVVARFAAISSVTCLCD